MTTATIEKRVNILEGRQPQPDFVPARWVTLKEGEALNDIQYAAEEASGIDIEKEEEQQRAGGCPEWMILVERENRADYYERKAKRQAEAQQEKR